ncbi:Mth938-like domain-containing protein [Pedomonas sp. V897]|uniref:Mth938-like domain-containing protein n=1 Tax=Pedomonas sp. V897 TaxID=3446482 RepID=UPI003EDEF842
MPKLEATPPRPGVLSIQGYSAGGYRVGGTVQPGGVIVTPERMEAWPVTDLASARVEDFQLVTTEQPPIEVLLLGTGPAMRRPPAALLEGLKAAGLAVDFMDSRAAARTYNVLVAENRRVAAALLPLD